MQMSAAAVGRHGDERQGATAAAADTTEEGFVVVVVDSSSNSATLSIHQLTDSLGSKRLVH